MDRQDELRKAAIVHACIPPELRTPENDPLLRLVPDGFLPDFEDYALVEAITGEPFDRWNNVEGPIPLDYVMPARVRSVLSRWAIRNAIPGIIAEEREHVRARSMWETVTGKIRKAVKR